MLGLLRAVVWRVLRHIVTSLLPERAGVLSVDVRIPQERQVSPGVSLIGGLPVRAFCDDTHILSKRRFQLISA